MNRYVCVSCKSEAFAASCPPYCALCFTATMIAEEEEEDDGPRGSTTEITPLDDVGSPQRVACRAPLMACVGGSAYGTVVVVGAGPGFGKSTEIARVAVDLNVKCGYIDNEMSASECRAVFVDAGADANYIRTKVRRIVPAGAGHKWEDALEQARAAKAKIVVVDSVGKWVKQQEEDVFTAYVKRFASETDSLVFLIQQWTRDGLHAKGTLTLEHAGALTIVLAWAKNKPKEHPYGVIDVTKARPPWSGTQGSYDRPMLAAGQTYVGHKISPWSAKELKKREPV